MHSLDGFRTLLASRTAFVFELRLNGYEQTHLIVCAASAMKLRVRCFDDNVNDNYFKRLKPANIAEAALASPGRSARFRMRIGFRDVVMIGVQRLLSPT